MFELPYQAALECVFEIALESAMRLREIYTLDVSQVDFEKRTIFLEKTKNGHKRQVPMTSVIIPAIREYMRCVEAGERGMSGFDFSRGRLFPWWDGSSDQRVLRGVTNRLSRQYSRIFAAAGCEDLHFHDLRHEATSRLFERTKMSDSRIAKITGHRSPAMLMRYANLRASDLSSELW